MMSKDGHITVSLLLMGLICLVTTNSTREECSACEQTPETWTEEKETELLLDFKSEEDLLEKVETLALQCTNSYEPVPVKVPTQLFAEFQGTVLLIKRVLEGHFPYTHPSLLQTLVEEVVLSEEAAISGRLLWIGNGSMKHPDYYAEINDDRADGLDLNGTVSTTYILESNVPWLHQNGVFPELEELAQDFYDHFEDSGWGLPYYSCNNHRWLISFTAFIISKRKFIPNDKRLAGLISADIDITSMDINQCDSIVVNINVSKWQIEEFLGTHKCDKRTSQCFFTPGYGWTRGAYHCECRRGFYSAIENPVFNGSAVERAYREKREKDNPTYDTIYVCKKCQPGCYECIDDSPCLSTYNWTFRGSLLSICIACILMTLFLSACVYRYRKLKVFKVASPIFLCITLLGCVIMYCEMAAIFPVLDMCTCIATKWTRHMGFCITYSALLLKTWRVSLTYRVKSAHKLKLTDKQLLQWLFPILLVMAIYLGTWTISAPPPAVYIKDWNQLKFKQCDYNWWDHSLGIGEFIFLLWGIKVCYNVRNAESVFNEARHISWAVHSITIVNIIMVLIHLIILPNAGPDEKYLFGFIRTQLSTTITIILIFGPKFYRVLTGQGDTWDSRARARGVTASFSINGLGPVYDEPPDLCVENEELKEEVQKLASQIEFMKIIHMEINNRHLKPKHVGLFSQQSNPSSNQSPVNRGGHSKVENSDSPSRISPAVELLTEKV